MVSPTVSKNSVGLLDYNLRTAVQQWTALKNSRAEQGHMILQVKRKENLIKQVNGQKKKQHHHFPN